MSECVVATGECGSIRSSMICMIVTNCKLYYDPPLLDKILNDKESFDEIVKTLLKLKSHFNLVETERMSVLFCPLTPIKIDKQNYFPGLTKGSVVLEKYSTRLKIWISKRPTHGESEEIASEMDDTEFITEVKKQPKTSTFGVSNEIVPILLAYSTQILNNHKNIERLRVECDTFTTFKTSTQLHAITNFFLIKW